MIIPIVCFIIGVIIIIYGGNKLVEGTVNVAKATGIKEVIIGATIVSLGTTLPELLISVLATIEGSSEIAFGNAIGSIIFNISIIGAVEVLFIINNKFDNKNLNWRVAYLIGGILLLYFLAVDGMLSRFDGLLLIIGLVFYFWLSINKLKERKLKSEKEKIAIKEFIKIIIGAICLYIGAKLMVDNGVVLATKLGLSERIIGLTIISIGTALPELITTIIAIIKKHSHIGYGNIIGANILNIFLVCGIASFIKQIFIVPSVLKIDIPLALGFVLLFTAFPLLKHKTYRFQGILLIASYAAYSIYLFS